MATLSEANAEPTGGSERVQRLLCSIPRHWIDIFICIVGSQEFQRKTRAKVYLLVSISGYLDGLGFSGLVLHSGNFYKQQLVTLISGADLRGTC